MKNIIISFNLEALHFWETCDIPEVSYLKNLHRHVFYFVCKKEVNHNDRDIEFIQLKHTMISFMESVFYDTNLKCLNFSSRSCEDLAQLLYNKYQLIYCSCLEDNENGAEIC